MVSVCGCSYLTRNFLALSEWVKTHSSICSNNSNNSNEHDVVVQQSDNMVIDDDDDEKIITSILDDDDDNNDNMVVVSDEVCDVQSPKKSKVPTCSEGSKSMMMILFNNMIILL